MGCFTSVCILCLPTGCVVAGSDTALQEAFDAGQDFRVMVQDGTDRVFFDVRACLLDIFNIEILSGNNKFKGFSQ